MSRWLGGISGALFFTIDISVKKKAEKALMEKMQEIEKMNKFMINRELKMIDLKKELEMIKAGYNDGDNKN